MFNLSPMNADIYAITTGSPSYFKGAGTTTIRFIALIGVYSADKHHYQVCQLPFSKQSIQHAKIGCPSIIIGGPALCERKPVRRSKRSTPIGETEISRFAPCATAQAMDSRSNSTIIGEENCPRAHEVWLLKSTAAKRESSHTSGVLGGGRPFSSCGKTSPRR